jgi:hypothetical protein
MLFSCMLFHLAMLVVINRIEMRTFFITHPVGPFSNLVIHLFVGATHLLECCCWCCLIGSQSFHLRPHLFHLAKPFVCIHLHVVLLFWSVRRTLYFHLTFLVLCSFSCAPSILFLFSSVSLVYTGATALVIESL